MWRFLKKLFFFVIEMQSSNIFGLEKSLCLSDWSDLWYSSYTRSTLCLKLHLLLLLTQDVLLRMRHLMCFFAFFICLNRLNIILLKSCTKAVVSDLIKWCFHPSDVNKAVSCSDREAVDLLWSCDLPFLRTIFEVMMITSCLLLSFCPRLSSNRL